jgi:hypothetical protein
MKSYAPMSIQNCMHTDFVDSAIRDLLDRGLIVTCEVVNPLTVSIYSNGKKRFILDLWVVNKHLWKQSG